MQSNHEQPLLNNPVFQDYSAIEALQESSEEAGWEVEYRQMQSGVLESRSILNMLGGISLVHESATRRLEIVAESPRDMVTVIVRNSPAGISINGHSLQNDEIMVLGSGSDFYCVSAGGARALSMHVPTALLEEVGGRLIPGFEGPGHGRWMAVRTRASALQACKSSMLAAIAGSPGQSQFDLAQTLFRAQAFAETRIRAGRRSNRTVQKAREYIDGNLANSIRMDEVCDWAGVGLRTLERAFQRELQQSPLFRVLQG